MTLPLFALLLLGIGIAVGAIGASLAAAKARRNRPSLGRLLFRENPTPMWIFDTANLGFLAVNDAAVARYGYSREEFLKMRITDIRPREDVDEMVAILPNLPDVRVVPATFRHRTRDGSVIQVEIISHAVTYAGRDARIVSSSDVTRRVDAETSLALAQQIAHVGSFTHNTGTGEHSWSAELYQIVGAAPGTFDLSEGLWPFDHPDDAERVKREVESARDSRRGYNIDHRIIRADGVVRYVQEQARWLYDSEGRDVVHFGTVLDITERKSAEAALEHLAYHDSLTGLPNRTALADSFERLLETPQEDALRAVLFIDLDRFKLVNDTLGHRVGDAVLVEIGERLRERLGAEDLVARPGGDEFIVVLARARDKMEIGRRAKDLLGVFNRPFKIAQHDHFVSASIGASIYPIDGRDVDTLLRNADAAMYAAKQSGGNTFNFYTAGLQYAAARRFRLENALHRALERREFTMYYQPVLSIEDSGIVAAEALLRWNDPELGMTLPSDFIPFAEESGLVLKIGEWVFTESIAQAKRWSDAGTPMRVWINVSASQLQTPAIVAALNDSLKDARLDPSLIGLELTESALINESQQTVSVLHQLKALGVVLALDDFGVKYSSLDYLRRLPIDVLKIDRSFLQDVAHDKFHQSIVRAIIGIAHDVGFTVTAEGVETQEQLTFLCGLGCDHWQGYYYSEARPPQDLSRLLAGKQTGYLANLSA
ncbi:MAG: EAL domain-containing protein [Candidatus Eremiobacteraeota bacterium]|nr:EAL domain-containing protein [Candidatus Eremiobacteraeota bacterium]